MRLKYNVRILVLLPAVVIAYASGWSQGGWSGVINSWRGEGAQNTRPAEAASAPLSAQKTLNGPAPTSVAALNSQEGSAAVGAVPIAVVPFILEYQHANLHFRQPIDDNPYFIRIEAMIQD